MNDLYLVSMMESISDGGIVFCMTHVLVICVEITLMNAFTNGQFKTFSPRKVSMYTYTLALYLQQLFPYFMQFSKPPDKKAIFL